MVSDGIFRKCFPNYHRCYILFGVKLFGLYFSENNLILPSNFFLVVFDNGKCFSRECGAREGQVSQDDSESCVACYPVFKTSSLR